MYKDKGVNLIGKIFNIEKKECLSDCKFAKALIETVISNLSIDIDYSEKNLFHSDEDNYMNASYLSESLSITIESFKKEGSVFVSFFVRKKCNIANLSKQFKLMLQNYGAKSMNYQIFYRP